MFKRLPNKLFPLCLLSSFITVVFLVAVLLPKPVSGQVANVPQIYSGSVRIGTLTIEEFLEPLRGVADLLEVDLSDSQFAVQAVMGSFQSPPVAVNESSKYDQLWVAPPSNSPFAGQAIRFRLGPLIAQQTDIFNGIGLPKEENDWLLTFIDGDQDGDGLSDLAESILGTLINDAHSDGDSINDGEEAFFRGDGYITNPKSNDTDTDKIADNLEIYGAGPGNYTSDPTTPHSDSDQIDDFEEVFLAIDGYVTDPTSSDTDGDGLTDPEEIAGLGPRGYKSDPSKTDTDGDGLNDGVETKRTPENPYVTDPNNRDTDDDQLEDGDEVNGSGLMSYKSDPTNSDTDSDLIGDWEEVFEGTDGYVTNPDSPHTDVDELTDIEEIEGVGPMFYTSDPTLFDSDNDGLNDRDESLRLASGNVTNPEIADTDQDGLTDWEEENQGEDGYITNPEIADTDQDGLTDGEETSGANAGNYKSDPANPNSDSDGLSDKEEVTSGRDGFITDPMNADTDGDGVPDNEEFTKGLNPTSTDSDGDFWNDGSDIWPNTNAGWFVFPSASALLIVVVLALLRIRKASEITDYKPEITAAVIKLANEWWGFIPKDEMDRIAPEFSIGGVNWRQHPMANKLFERIIADAGGIEVSGDSDLAKGYRFPEIMRRYSKDDSEN